MPTGVYPRKTRAPRARFSGQRRVDTIHDAPKPAPVTATADKGASSAGDTPAEPVRLTGPLVRMIETVRAPFMAYVDDFAQLEQTREELAPRFMRAFNKWQSETGGTFVAFVRLFVPDVPLQSRSNDKGSGYKDHTAYRAADYLRRKAAEIAREEAATPVQRAQAIANRPVSQRTAFGRLLAMVLPLLDESALGQLRRAMHDGLNWTDNQVNGLIELAGTETPLARVRPPRGVHLEHSLKLSVIPTQEGEQLAATA